MAKKSNVATIVIGNSKYEIESDTIVNITMSSGAVFEYLRVTGLSRMGDCIRCVSKTDGIVEIPYKNIKKIEDVVNTGVFSGVKITTRK